MADITMPQLGETVTEGTITKWHKQVGEAVAADEVLFEVSTDKVDSEVPSPISGTLAEIVAKEGDTVPVGGKIAVVSEGAAPAAAPPAAEGSSGQPQANEPEPGETADELAARDAGTKPLTAEEIQEAPHASEAATAVGEAARTADPAVSVAPAGLAGATPPALGGKVVSPLVRKLINENGLDPAQIQGTGAGGRITREDVEALVGNGGAPRGRAPSSGSLPADANVRSPDSSPAAPQPSAPSQPAAPQPSAAAAGAQQSSAPAASAAAQRGDQRIPFSNIRRRTAEHMVRSKATSAHTLVVIEVDYANVEKVRLPVRKKFKEEEGASLTYLPFITRAVVDAIREFPHVNSSVGNDELIIHRDINVGYAVDINFEGLLVPVIHGTDTKRLRGIARELADLANRARSKKLGADDIAGGTFTITNPGSYGTMLTAAVISQPQVAILSTDGVKKRPVAIELPDGSDGIVVHPVGNLALSWDHRAFDGAYASAFIAKIKEILETRDWAQEL